MSIYFYAKKKHQKKLKPKKKERLHIPRNAARRKRKNPFVTIYSRVFSLLNAMIANHIITHIRCFTDFSLFFSFFLYFCKSVITG